MTALGFIQWSKVELVTMTLVGATNSHYICLRVPVRLIPAYRPGPFGITTRLGWPQQRMEENKYKEQLRDAMRKTLAVKVFKHTPALNDEVQLEMKSSLCITNAHQTVLYKFWTTNKQVIQAVKDYEW